MKKWIFENYFHFDDMLVKDVYVVDQSALFHHFFDNVLELYLNDDVKQMLLVDIRILYFRKRLECIKREITRAEIQ
jgi:hypothetical protein